MATHDAAAAGMEGAASAQRGMAAASEGRKVYVSNLPRAVNDAFLRSAFSPYGEVEEVVFLRSKSVNERISAFVVMASGAGARAAIHALSNWMPEEGSMERATVRLSTTAHNRRQPPAPPNFHQQPARYAPPLAPAGMYGGGMVAPVASPCKLYIAGLPPESTDVYLADLFRPYGYVDEAVVLRKNQGRNGTLSGFVWFRDPESASKALVLDGATFDGGSGRKLGVRYASKDSGRTAAAAMYPPVAPVTPVYPGYGGMPPGPPPMASPPAGRGGGGVCRSASAAAGAGPPAKRVRMEGPIRGSAKTPIKLYVAGLDPGWGESVLQDMFAPYGEVLEASLLTVSGTSGLRSGIVWIRGAPGAQAAIDQLNGKQMEGSGKALTVRQADA
eukprot:TRINITY_DN11286_c0_g1_i1.p1 TRINITY_DN11286_c0_g1~~TRINITY_DN11286_c0_g1_i1.p1  ORF type:complete len:387 (+),score=48.68 TRINITY_DN11286_c0_g1_i1:59-1219(+)